MRMIALLLVLAAPQATQAAPFFIETTYATYEAPVKEVSSSSRAPILHAAPATAEVPVVSSVSSAATVTSSSTPPPPPASSSVQSSSASSQTQEETDDEILGRIPEYLEDDVPLSEQLTLLKNGFTVTGTSTLGSPLPANMRSAILRSEVQSFSQLKLFAKALAESDENLRKFTVDDEGITMTYRNKGYLFGFIPLSYLTTVSAKFDGTIEVDVPWWLRIARDTNKEFIVILQSDLGEPLQESINQESRKFQTISNVLKTMHDTAKAMIQNTRA